MNSFSGSVILRNCTSVFSIPLVLDMAGCRVCCDKSLVKYLKINQKLLGSVQKHIKGIGGLCVSS